MRTRIRVQTGLKPYKTKKTPNLILNFFIPKGYVFTYPRGICIFCNILIHRQLSGRFEYRWDHQQKPLTSLKSKS